MIMNSLKKIREEEMSSASDPSHWTQDALAARVGVTRQTIIAIERGKYNPTLELAFRLAKEFGISIEKIFSYRKDDNE